MSREERHPQSDRGVANQRSGRKVRRRCRCGQVIAGNAAWWSHLNAHQDDPEHGYNGRA